MAMTCQGEQSPILPLPSVASPPLSSPSIRFLFLLLTTSHYISVGNNTNMIKWTMKARCKGLALNYKNWKSEQTECGMSIQPETTVHFIGECSTILELRLLYLNSVELTENESYYVCKWTKLEGFI